MPAPPKLAELPAVGARVREELSQLDHHELFLPGLLGAQAARLGDAPFLLHAGERLSYRAVDRLSNQYAHALLARHVAAGDMVALMASNCVEWVLAWFGAFKVGATLVPVNPALKGADLAHIIGDSEARLVLCDDASLRVVRETAGRLPVPVDVAPLVGFADGADDDGLDPFVPEPSHRCEIAYTSGTTGPPKGVVLGPDRFGPAARLLGAMLGLDGDDVLYTCLPLFHLNAQGLSVMVAMALGASVAVAPRFSASRFWRDLVDCGATQFTYIGGMPAILMNTAPVPEERQHRVRVCLGAAMPPEIWEAFEERFGVEVLEFYGQTEGGMVWNGPDGKVGAMGRPIPGSYEIRVVDDDGRDAGPNEPGELWSRPAMDGADVARFWKNPGEQRARTAGGWLRSGDIVYRDEDGFLFFVDRKKDALRRRGENISTWSIENAVGSHPAVLECAAYGVPSELGEDDIKVDVVLREGATLEPAALVDWCRDRLADFMLPRYVQVRDHFPKTGTERVQKARLRAEGTAAAWDRESSDVRTSTEQKGSQ